MTQLFVSFRFLFALRDTNSASANASSHSLNLLSRRWTRDHPTPPISSPLPEKMNSFSRVFHHHHHHPTSIIFSLQNRQHQHRSCLGLFAPRTWRANEAPTNIFIKHPSPNRRHHVPLLLATADHSAESSEAKSSDGRREIVVRVGEALSLGFPLWVGSACILALWKPSAFLWVGTEFQILGLTVTMLGL